MTDNVIVEREKVNKIRNLHICRLYTRVLIQGMCKKRFLFTSFLPQNGGRNEKTSDQEDLP